MGLKIDRKQDKRVVHACTHMLADIPNGVTVPNWLRAVFCRKGRH
jgi:hypothetical protein